MVTCDLAGSPAPHQSRWSTTRSSNEMAPRCARMTAAVVVPTTLVSEAMSKIEAGVTGGAASSWSSRP